MGSIPATLVIVKVLNTKHKIINKSISNQTYVSQLKKPVSLPKNTINAYSPSLYKSIIYFYFNYGSKNLIPYTAHRTLLILEILFSAVLHPVKAQDHHALSLNVKPFISPNVLLSTVNKQKSTSIVNLDFANTNTSAVATFSNIDSILVTVDLLNLYTKSLRLMPSSTSTKIISYPRRNFIRKHTLSLDTGSLNYFINKVGLTKSYNIININVVYSAGISNLVSNLSPSKYSKFSPRVHQSSVPKPLNNAGSAYLLTKKARNKYRSKLLKLNSNLKNTCNFLQGKFDNSFKNLFFRRRKKVVWLHGINKSIYKSPRHSSFILPIALSSSITFVHSAYKNFSTAGRQNIKLVPSSFTNTAADSPLIKSYALLSHPTLYYSLYSPLFYKILPSEDALLHSENTNNLTQLNNISLQKPLKFIIYKKIKQFITNSFVQKNISVWYYNTFIRFLGYCTGLNVMLQYYMSVDSCVDASSLALYKRWMPRMAFYERNLGHRFFLEEALHIIHLSFRLHDSLLFSSWLKAIVTRISFWKTRSIFRFLKYLFNNYLEANFGKMSIKGFKVRLKGKISAAGNSRKRNIIFRSGQTSYSSTNLKCSYTFSRIVTFTGVMGFQIWIFY